MQQYRGPGTWTNADSATTPLRSFPMRSAATKLRLIVATDTRLAAPRDIVHMVGDALRAGCPAVQLREKELPARDVLPLARTLRRATHDAGALLFVNDRLDVALAVGADGVHLGPDDLPVGLARQMAPPSFMIGYSASTVARARSAIASGADYIGCGPVFPTTTKPDAGSAIGVAQLARIAQAIDAPVVAIGGITPENAPSAIQAGAAGVAAIGAVMTAADPRATTSGLLAAAEAHSSPWTNLPRHSSGAASALDRCSLRPSSGR